MLLLLAYCSCHTLIKLFSPRLGKLRLHPVSALLSVKRPFILKVIDLPGGNMGKRCGKHLSFLQIKGRILADPPLRPQQRAAASQLGPAGASRIRHPPLFFYPLPNL